MQLPPIAQVHKNAVISRLTAEDRVLLGEPTTSEAAIADIAARLDGTAGLSAGQLQAVLSEAVLNSAFAANDRGLKAASTPLVARQAFTSTDNKSVHGNTVLGSRFSMPKPDTAATALVAQHQQQLQVRLDRVNNHSLYGPLQLATVKLPAAPC